MIKVTWSASTEIDVTGYELQRAAAVTGPYAAIVTIPNTQDAAHWDGSYFFYDDAAGADSSFYRLIAIDAAGNRSAPSEPFQASASTPAIPNTVRVDHNYGSAAALRYITASGLPIENAVVRVFRKAEFDLGRTDAPLAATQTDSQGNWRDPIYLTTGYTYVVQFAKEGLYGPDHAEIVV